MKVGLSFATLLSTADAHGALISPPPRNNYHDESPMDSQKNHARPDCGGDDCHWFNEGCWLGCEKCTSEMPDGGNYRDGHPQCEDWKPTEPTLPEKYRTWNIDNLSGAGDFTKYHPWRAPGHAPVVDPCAVAGAYKNSGDVVPAGSKRGDLGSKLPKLGVTTKWTAGGVAEVTWMPGTNHGGGYSYMLCPAGEPITEACFQQHAMDFVGDHHTIRYLDNGTQFDIPAMQINEGTLPVGSTWRRNPIPACNCDDGRQCTYDGKKNLNSAYTNDAMPQPAHKSGAAKCATGTMFPVPFDYGYGDKLHTIHYDSDSPDRFFWGIVDQVRVPEEPGDYVLRWRWDCEQTAQVWSHCADVTVVAGGLAV